MIRDNLSPQLEILNFIVSAVLFAVKVPYPQVLGTQFIEFLGEVDVVVILTLV